MSFTGDGFDELIKENRLITQILLAKLIFDKNVWVTLLIFSNTRRFVPRIFTAEVKAQRFDFPATFFFAKKSNVRLFFTAWWEQKKRGCNITDPNTSVILWSTSTEILLRRGKADHKHRWRNLWRQFFWVQVVLSTWISLNLGQRSFQVDTLQRS